MWAWSRVSTVHTAFTAGMGLSLLVAPDAQAGQGVGPQIHGENLGGWAVAGFFVLQTGFVGQIAVAIADITDQLGDVTIVGHGSRGPNERGVGFMTFGASSCSEKFYRRGRRGSQGEQR